MEENSKKGQKEWRKRHHMVEFDLSSLCGEVQTSPDILQNSEMKSAIRSILRVL
jgi:hypothetical protein